MEKKKEGKSGSEHYADIFWLPHWEPSGMTSTGLLKHPRMPMEKRAAIFAPFEALEGHKESVEEETRLTDEEKCLTDEERSELDRRFRILVSAMRGSTGGHAQDGIIQAHGGAPSISVTYFVPDQRKAGGGYQTVSGSVQKANLYEKWIQFENGTVVRLDSIALIDGPIFAE